MKKSSAIQKIVASILSVLMLIQFTGCRTLETIPRSEITYAEKIHYYIHGAESSYEVSGTSIENGLLTGIISHPVNPPPKGKIMNLYVSPDSAITVNDGVISIPAANIAKAEIYSIDSGRTIGVVAGAAAGAFWTTIIIVWITKGLSCPFVYSEDGADIQFEGEIYSGATAVPIERNDYLKLKALSPVDDLYRIRITNEVKEIQRTNLAELQVYDHPREVEILVDKYGVAHSVRNIMQPVTATDTYGRSLLPALSACDNARYFSEIRNDNLLLDTISLSFDRPHNSTSAKLVISAKNTMWLDYMFGRLSDMFGNRYDEWVKIRNKRSPEYLKQWSLDQGIPLAVYLETASGLEFVDYYNVPGPAKDKKDILSIDLSRVTGDRVNIRLVSGVLFWDFDYAGMDFSEEVNVTCTTVPVENAVDETGKEISSLLLHDDDKYLVQPEINNEARLSFMVPPPVPGTERSVFLHSKGNYQPLRDAGGKPDMDLLVTMRQPGMFTKFAKDHFLRYYSSRN